MLKLQIPSDRVRQEYLARFLNKLEKRVKDGFTVTSDGKTYTYELEPEAKEILLPNWNTSKPNTEILKKLLISKPKDLKRLNDKLIKELNAISDDTHRPSNDLLLKIFGYEKTFNNSNKTDAYWLAQKIGRNTCTYCNRIYTFTVIKDDGTNYCDRIVRPDFDHWFDKSDFPLMSMSLFNLIPSCPICNRSIKGSVKFDLSTHIHPYVHENGHPQITFRAVQTPTNPPKWSVVIDAPDGSKEKKTIEDLKLDEIYAYHGELEIKDLMHFNYSYSNGYLKQLFEDVLNDSNHTLSKKEVFRMIFGTEMEAIDFLDRPLSKMKYDILHNMGVI